MWCVQAQRPKKETRFGWTKVRVVYSCNYHSSLLELLVALITNLPLLIFTACTHTKTVRHEALVSSIDLWAFKPRTRKRQIWIGSVDPRDPFDFVVGHLVFESTCIVGLSNILIKIMLWYCYRQRAKGNWNGMVPGGARGFIESRRGCLLDNRERRTYGCASTFHYQPVDRICHSQFILVLIIFFLCDCPASPLVKHGFALFS